MNKNIYIYSKLITEMKFLEVSSWYDYEIPKLTDTEMVLERIGYGSDFKLTKRQRDASKGTNGDADASLKASETEDEIIPK